MAGRVCRQLWQVERELKMNFAVQKDASLTIAGPSGAIQVSVSAAKEGGILIDRNLAVVICHPHPLHGGTMDNKVVTTLARTYRDLGVKVIRFNFRGVGASEGVFDNAVGEVDDLMSVIAWVKAEWPAVELMLAGFSFGSSVAAQASHRLERLHHLLLVAPPIERYPYDQDGLFPCPTLVVQGGDDERVVATDVYAWAETLSSPVELIRYETASHFFHGYLTSLKDDLSEVIPRQLRLDR
jgi:alpha/beta superfamily hydrolase